MRRGVIQVRLVRSTPHPCGARAWLPTHIAFVAAIARMARLRLRADRGRTGESRAAGVCALGRSPIVAAFTALSLHAFFTPIA